MHTFRNPSMVNINVSSASLSLMPLVGLPTIRSYGEVPRFIKDDMYYIDLENRALLLMTTNQRYDIPVQYVRLLNGSRWLTIRLDALGAMMVFFVRGGRPCVCTFLTVPSGGPVCCSGCSWNQPSSSRSCPDIYQCVLLAGML